MAGYVSREGSLHDLVAAIDSAARGEMLCTPRVAATLLRRVSSLAAERPPAQPFARLTNRQLEIVRLIEQGLTNKEIARRLCIELPTVKNHLHNIFEKLDVHRRGELASVVRRGTGTPF
jgi:DNA-binding NarL/FixJ family response regulator